MWNRGYIARAVVVGAILLVPGFWYLRTAREWEVKRATPVTGDEPHYLILAEAIAHDHSLRVKGAYERDAASYAIYGPIDWEKHTRTNLTGTYSLHSPGLSIAIFTFFQRYGLIGVRTFLSILAASVPFLFFFVARVAQIDRASSVVLALSASFSLPFLAASGQIFPDLPTGVLLLALSLGLFASSTGELRQPVLGLIGMLLASLPWLHLKSVAPMLILTLSFVVLQASRGVQKGLKSSVWFTVPVLCSLALLGYYNHLAFGSVLGPYGSADADATMRQTAMIFLGLHLDQAQGVFIQQPLFLLALPGVAVLGRRRPMVAFAMLATYLSVTIPNSIHPCWYGCASFSGRFMWSVAALWFVPLAVLYKEMRPAERIGVLAIGVLAVIWQASLMNGWRADPGSLYLRFQGSLAERNSLFSLGLRRFLPSFYEFDGYLDRATNILAIALVLILIGVGVWHARKEPRLSDPKRHLLLPILAPIVVFAIATACLHAKTSVSIDLLQRFSQAELRPRGAERETFELTTKTIGTHTESALLARVPSRITWTLTIPRDAELRVWLGIDQEMNGETDGVLFRVGIADITGYTELLTKAVGSNMAGADLRWIPVQLDLSRYGGKEVSVILNTNTVSPGKVPPTRLPYWGAPIIRTY